MYCLQSKFWSNTQGADFALQNYLFGAVKLTKNVDSDKHKYSDHAIGFDACRSFSSSDGSWFGKNVIFDADMSSLVHITFYELNLHYNRMNSLWWYNVEVV